MIQIRVNSKTYEVPDNIEIIEACRQIGVYIPSLCYHSDLPPEGHCGLCCVKIDGTSHAYACMTKVRQGLTISTTDDDVIEKAKRAFEKFMDMSRIPMSKDIEDVMKHLYGKSSSVVRKREKTPAITFLPQECINCNRCVRMCADIMDVGALDDPTMALKQGPCISCGQCTLVCPTPALTETFSTGRVLRALATGMHCVALVDASAMVGIGDAFDDKKQGVDITGKLVGALRSMGFKNVFDLRGAVDLMTAEMGEELLHRLEKKERLPLIISSCPATVNFVEKSKPEVIQCLSTIKTPQQILSRILKGPWAKSKKLAVDKVFVVLVTSCVATKDENVRMQVKDNVNDTLTVREVVKMIDDFGLVWSAIRPKDFDEVFRSRTETSSLTSLSGGWTQAILKYIAAKNGSDPKDFEFTNLTSTTKEGEFTIGGKKIKTVICDGSNAGHQLVATDEQDKYQLVEIMACPGGCAFGGGQPKLSSRRLASARIEALKGMAKGQPEKSAVRIFSTFDILSDKLTKESAAELRKHFVTHFERQEYVQTGYQRRTASLPIVAYGSTNGKATRYARLVSSFVHTNSQAMNNVTIEQILLRKTVIFICASYGQGGFPANAARFANLLAKSSADMSEVSFCVLALGRTSAGNNYCAAGVKLFDMMKARGAKPMLPLTKVDSLAPDGGDNIYAIWSNDLATAMYLKKPKIGLELMNHFEACEDTSIVDKPSRPTGYEFAEMTDRLLMSPEGYVPAMHRYTFKLPDGMTYEPGDTVCVLPCNDKEIVDSVLEALKLEGNAVMSIQTGDPVIPQKVTVRQLFTQYLDLNCLPPHGLLCAFLEAANDEGKSILSALTDEKNPEAFNEFLKDVTSAEAILKFAKYGIPTLDVLVSAITHMGPRFYSVASAPDAHRGYLDIMVVDVVWGENNKRYGITTHFLSNPNLTRVALQCKKGVFRYPADTEAPIIMVALGSGVSPMFSLLQFRQMTDKKLGPAYLFFGAKYEGSYPLLLKKLRNFRETNVVQELFVCFSQDSNKKHVQDLIKENASKVWELWQDHRTKFYYCGPHRGIPDELKRIMVDITMNEGWLSSEEAMAVNNRHDWVFEGQ